MAVAGVATTACLMEQSVRLPATPQLLLTVSLERMSVIMVGTPLLDAGWEITVCQWEPAPRSVTAQHHLTVALEKLSATWDHMRDVGRATCASQRVQSVLMSATTPLLLNVWSPRFSATWDLLKAVGMATTAQLMEQSVLQCVTTLFPPNVWRENLPVTWDIMLVAGWEISAMRIWVDSSVLQFATGPLTLHVRKARFCATWVLMLITAGWEITACPRAPYVLRMFDQTSDGCLNIIISFLTKLFFFKYNWQ